MVGFTVLILVTGRKNTHPSVGVSDSLSYVGACAMDHPSAFLARFPETSLGKLN
jgi:hypothetical protein